jgi:hypothetical protein
MLVKNILGGDMAKYIIKSSGEQEPFNIQKFTHSLRRVHADPAVIKKLAEDIERIPSLRTTKDIYSYAYNHLLTLHPGAAIRYNLKNALYELGPVGFPFEQYVAEIFRHQGYKATTNLTLQGSCIPHEIDVIAHNNHVHALIECKFRGLFGEKINIKIPLYVKARYDDILLKQKSDNKKPPFNQIWIVTNTHFTDSSKIYAHCAGIHLLGWDHPKNNGIEVLIDNLQLHPITILRTLTHKHKKALIEEGILLCRDLRNHKDALFKLGLDEEHVNQVLIESEMLYNNHLRLY